MVVFTDGLQSLEYFLRGNLTEAFLFIVILMGISLISLMYLMWRLSTLNSRYSKMMRGMDGVNLEELLMKHIEEVRELSRKVQNLSMDCQRLGVICDTATQKVGVVRFNAFEDTGSDLSYAVAMLDAKNNGVVFSSLYGRSEARTYAKPLQGGQSTYFLTDEEKQAIENAKKQNK